jgi:asparagine synthase (glutamine-hydrolysing)
MCGIAGLVGAFVPNLMAQMNAAQAHRGPDGQGVFEDNAVPVALGHVRLAILDLSTAAHQPMHSADERFVIVFNGEIYNFAELREELAKSGESFKSTGDTEVLLRGLALSGPPFIEKLNGMFSFALWDRRERELLIARDQIGIKPLYYAEPEPGTLIFASEIKALCAYQKLRREPDFEALRQHLAYCYASGDRTALKGVHRLSPGHWLRWKAGRPIEIKRYWRPPFSSGAKAAAASDYSQSVKSLREEVRAASIRQLVSDVPVGAFLSGGLDSSLVTICAAEKAGERFQAYTISVPNLENRLDQMDPDAPHARSLAKKLGIKLNEIEIKPEVASLLPKLVHHLDEPLADPAVIACYLISKLAKEHGTTVLLSGQGADELFCGYPRYRAMRATGWMENMPRFLRRGIAAGAHGLPGSLSGKAGATLRRTRRVLTVLDQDSDSRFLNYCAATLEDNIASVLRPEVRSALKYPTFMGECLNHMEAECLNGLERGMERDLSIYLPNHNLMYTDKMGMAVSVETRVPLLDMEVVNRAVAYPAEWKLRGDETKAILRDASRGLVPDSIIDRPKSGFGAPYRKWLREDLADMWNDLTSERSVTQRAWFNYDALQEARRRSQSGREDLYMLQWAVMTIELWARAFVDRNPAFA